MIVLRVCLLQLVPRGLGADWAGARGSFSSGEGRQAQAIRVTCSFYRWKSLSLCKCTRLFIFILLANLIELLRNREQSCHLSRPRGAFLLWGKDAAV